MSHSGQLQNGEVAPILSFRVCQGSPNALPSKLDVDERDTGTEAVEAEEDRQEEEEEEEEEDEEEEEEEEEEEATTGAGADE